MYFGVLLREFEPLPSREDPDGARGKRFDVSGQFGRCGFEWISHTGRTKGTCPPIVDASPSFMSMKRRE
jgi:hypothetical protein